jgi:uncharacterized protein (TIGR02246 family)
MTMSRSSRPARADHFPVLFVLAVLPVLFVLFTAAAPAKPDPASDRAKILAIEDRLRAAYAASNPDAIAAEYTEDALLMPPDNPSQVGRPAIAAVYRTYFKDFKCDFKSDVQELEIAGDWAFLRGAFTTVVTPKAGGPQQGGHGKFLVIVRRGADGTWRFARDMFSPDSPLPPQ